MSGLVIGKIVKAHGVRGEIKVVPITDDVSRFNSLKNVFIGENEPYKVQSARIDGETVVLKIEGIDTRNDAESTIGKFLSVSRADAVPLKEGRYFIVDLIGCTVKCGGKVAGTLVDVLQHGAADVYVMNCGGKTVMFPAVADVFKKIDVDAKVIELDEKRFSEVAVYD